MISTLVAFVATLTVALIIIRYQHLHGHITADHDLRGIQKFHASPVPRVGGVALLIGFFFGQLAEFMLNPDASILGFMLIVTALPAFLAGLTEDLTKRVSVRKRLLATAFSALLGGILLGGWLDRLDISYIDGLMGYFAVSALITCFAVAGVANSFNLIDGYNGLAGMIGLIILVGLAYVAFQVDDVAIAIVAITLCGAILGFFVWNYPRGLIFLGDGGAYLIGFLVAELCVLLVVRNHEVSPWFPLVLVFYPIFETVFTIYRRVFVGKKSPGLPDAAHLHQLVYRRVVRWAVGSDCAVDKSARNALTAPYLWAMASFAVVPSLLFWRHTAALQIVSVLYSVFYVYVYRAIYRRKVPSFFCIKK